MCIFFTVHLYYMFQIYSLYFIISIFSKILEVPLFLWNWSLNHLAFQFICEELKALAAFFFSMFLLNGELSFHFGLSALSRHVKHF